MATAEEKQALGLGPDATEADITARITELTEGRERLEKQISEEREARQEAERVAEDTAAQARQEADGLRDQVASLRQTKTLANERTDTTGGTPSVAAHPVAQTDTREDGVPNGNKITIKIRAFPYYVDVEDPVTLRPMREERIAVRGQTVSVSDIDFRRAKKFDAFYSEDELAEIVEKQGRELDITDATVPDIAHWLQTEKPSIPVILDEVNNDPGVAQRVIDAENHATGGEPREELISELEEIANG